MGYYRYDNSQPPHPPPAPIIIANVSDPMGKKTKAVRCLVDTGANCTALPKETIIELQLKSAGSYHFIGFDEKILERDIYPAILSLGHSYTFEVYITEHIFPKEFKDEDKFGLIGRDILNQLVLFFDGKRDEFGIFKDCEKDKLIVKFLE